MRVIHPTAIVSSKAKLGENIIVHPYTIIHDNVEVGEDCEIGPHAVLYDGARLGNRVKIYQSASIAHVPQDISFKNEDSLFIIDDDTTIHEFVTCHRGTKSTGFSKIGKNCLIMAYSHVAHDCVVGNRCILANGVQLGGHVVIEDYAIIGGMTTVHQFSKVGQHSMTGGSFKISQDLPPFILAAHTPLKYCGLNIVGLRRRGFASQDIEALKKAYNYLYDKSLNVSQAVKKIEAELGENYYVRQTLEFIKNSKRGLVGK
jgi:UDP-N-acetylglucosamine acyltransferase